MINLLHTVYWEISLVCCIVTRACGTRVNTSNRLVVFPSIECTIYMYAAARWIILEPQDGPDAIRKQTSVYICT